MSDNTGSKLPVAPIKTRLGGMAKRSAAMQIADDMPAPSALACHPEDGRTFLEAALE